jgi:multidrug resistance efflux pump
VRADIINVAADVTGEVVDVPVRDNQLVKKGDLLMQIDPEHYRIAVKQAQSLVASRKATWEMRKVNAHRRADLDNLVISKENRDDASNIADSALADYQHAQAQLEAAELNLNAPKCRGGGRLRDQPQRASRRLRAHRRSEDGRGRHELVLGLRLLRRDQAAACARG